MLVAVCPWQVVSSQVSPGGDLPGRATLLQLKERTEAYRRASFLTRMRRRKAPPKAQGAAPARRRVSSSPARSGEAQGSRGRGPARCSAAESQGKFSAACHPMFAPSLPGCAGPDSLAEPASSCREGGLGPPWLRDSDAAGYHVHVSVGYCRNYGVPQDSCHPSSPGTLSVPCLTVGGSCQALCLQLSPSMGHNHSPASPAPSLRRDLACTEPMSSRRVLRLFSGFFAQAGSSV